MGRFRFFVLLAVVVCNRVEASVQFVDIGANDFRIESVTDVDIGGTLYDATFFHGISYNDFLAATSNEPTFTTAASATEAIEALRSEINSAVIGFPQANPVFTDFYFVSTGAGISTPGLVDAAIDITSGINPLLYDEFLPHTTTGFSEGQALFPSFAWVGFSGGNVNNGAVPEPNSMLVWAMLGVVGLRRRFLSS